MLTRLLTPRQPLHQHPRSCTRIGRATEAAVVLVLARVGAKLRATNVEQAQHPGPKLRSPERPGEEIIDATGLSQGSTNEGRAVGQQERRRHDTPLSQRSAEFDPPHPAKFVLDHDEIEALGSQRVEGILCRLDGEARETRAAHDSAYHVTHVLLAIDDEHAVRDGRPDPELGALRGQGLAIGTRLGALTEKREPFPIARLETDPGSESGTAAM